MISAPAQKLAPQVAALVHADRKKEAAAMVAESCKLKINLGKDENPQLYLPVLQNWLHYLLNNGGTVEAAQLLWSPNRFSPEPQYTKDLWKLFDEASMGLVMGAGSCSKSFGFGVRLYLEYIRDPEYTGIRVVGPSQDHLEANLFSDLVGLHTEASLPMPGTTGELFIGLNRRNQLGSIKGLVIPTGQVKKAGKLQGVKCKPRPRAHPIFGALSRVFVFIDEIENVPAGLWKDVDNILTQVKEDGVDGFKIFGAYNPMDRASKVAEKAEPPFGWDNINADVHYRWKSKRGWEVLRLDGERSENVVQNKTVFPGLQTRAGLEAIAKNAGGRDSAGYASMGRGMYPTQGATITVVPPGMFPQWRGEYIWYQDPQPAASCDLALEGGAKACLTLGKWGLASGKRFPPNIEFPKGRVEMFKDKLGRVMPRYGLQADQQFSLPKGESVEMAHNIVSVLKKAGVKPQFFACDRTGHGAGVADIIRNIWSEGIHDINYSSSSSESKLMQEDLQTCYEEYDRLSSELWFAMRAYGEHGYLLLAPTLELSQLTQQVTQRLMATGKKSKVESKKDYMGRGFASPDEADSLTLFVHAARKGSAILLSRLGESVTEEEEGEMWYEVTGQHRIDPSNTTDYL